MNPLVVVIPVLTQLAAFCAHVLAPESVFPCTALGGARTVEPGHLNPRLLSPATCEPERYVAAHGPLAVQVLLAHLAVALVGRRERRDARAFLPALKQRNVRAAAAPCLHGRSSGEMSR
jgi:hypothetical protein